MSDIPVPTGEDFEIELEGEFTSAGNDPFESSYTDDQPNRLDIDDEEREKILEFLLSETKTALEERIGAEEKWAKWERQVEMRPEFEVKNDPWPGASNVVTPASRIATRAIAALLKEAFSDRDPFWTYEDIREQLVEESRALTKYVQSKAESPEDLDWRNVQGQLFPLASNIGTAFLKIPWVRKTRGIRTDRGGIDQTVEQLLKDGIDPMVISTWEFVTRAHFDDIQECPWISHYVDKYWHELQELSNKGIYIPESVDLIEAAFNTRSDAMMSHVNAYYTSRDEMYGITPDFTNGNIESQQWRIFEYWFDWIFEGDTIASPLIFHIEPVTRTILRENYNRFGPRPFSKIGLEKRKGRLYAIGAGWVGETLQDEIDTHHNMRVDATHMSTVKMYKVSTRSRINQTERIRPGKLWHMPSPKDDMMELQTGEVSQSSFQAEQVALQMLDRALGVNDALLGYSDSVEKTRASVGGRVLQLQQRTKLFRETVESIESDFADVGMLVFYQLLANKDKVRADLRRYPEDIQRGVEAFLSIPLEDVPSRVRVRARTTPIDETEDAKRQSMLTIVQLYSMYWQQIIQTQMMANNPQVPQPVRELLSKQFIGMTRRMKEIMTLFDEDEIDKKLPLGKMREYERQLEAALVQRQIVGAIRGALQNGGARRQIGGPSVQADLGGAGAPQGAAGSPGLAGIARPPGQPNTDVNGGSDAGNGAGPNIPFAR